MRGKGITYDTGFIHQGASNRPVFEPDVVRREMRIIHDDLHCTAVRVTGGDPDRLEIAAELGAASGLEVWFSPFTSDLTVDELLAFLADCAERAERLRRSGAEIVAVTGAELTLFTRGFLPGETLEERVALLGQPRQLHALIAEVPARLNDFLGRAVHVVRERFGGKVSYAAIPTERVDWAAFDFVGVDAYRSIEVADRYRDGIRALVARGKPVAITEFGCATFHGAADRGAKGMDIVEWDGATPVRLKGDFTRDEAGQAGYLRELLDIFEAEGVDTAFAYTFAAYNLPHREDPPEDWDLASFGLARVLERERGRAHPDTLLEPKAAFTALADYYRG
ncbi:MAG TPA: hypothetical protein VMU89_21345 [Thermomicrobiaceae bacterium]|nr:hypothetical protein [Thermomicrobiaceae bacterium]